MFLVRKDYEVQIKEANFSKLLYEYLVEMG